MKDLILEVSTTIFNKTAPANKTAPSLPQIMYRIQESPYAPQPPRAYSISIYVLKQTKL